MEEDGTLEPVASDSHEAPLPATGSSRSSPSTLVGDAIVTFVPEDDLNSTANSWDEAAQYLDLPESSRLVACFGSETAVHEIWKLIGSTLRSIDEQEHAHLQLTVAHLTQFLLHLVLQPSIRHGEALRDFVNGIRQCMKVRADWPKGPLEDPRKGTIVQGADALIFEHKSEGLIRLQWVNPLPMPDWLQHGGYQCDVCMETEELLMGYQHVTEDNNRDLSSFMVCRIGYDVCAQCAVSQISKWRDNLRTWLRSVELGANQQNRRPCAEGAVQPELSISVSPGAGSLEVDVVGTAGLYISVAVLPIEEERILLPGVWLGAGSQLPPTSPEVRPAPDPLEGAVEFACACGDCVQITCGGQRGTLHLARNLHSSDIVSHPYTEFTLRALSLSQREVPPEEAESLGGVYQPGDSAAFLSFGAPSQGGAGRGVWLPPEPRSSLILAELHSLASRNGVVHNIPRQAPSDEGRIPTKSSDAMVVDAGPEPCGPRLLQSPGTATGYNVSEHWAGLSDCMICLDGLGDETWIRGPPLRTQCGHYFHAKCLQKHIRSAVNPNHGASEKSQLAGQDCPNCRAKDPLEGAQPAGGHGTQRWKLNRDVRDRELEIGKGYRVVAILCQDPEAVVDSAMMFACQALQWHPSF